MIEKRNPHNVKKNDKGLASEKYFGFQFEKKKKRERRGLFIKGLLVGPFCYQEKIIQLAIVVIKVCWLQ